jgi:hypothetical protein
VAGAIKLRLRDEVVEVVTVLGDWRSFDRGRMLMLLAY